MTMQSSGQIKLSEIATEFGGSAPHALSEYYDADTPVPASGQIEFSDFYGTSDYTPSTQTYTSNSTYTIHPSETSIQYKISGGGGGGGGAGCVNNSTAGGSGGTTTLTFNTGQTITASGGAGGPRGSWYSGGGDGNFNNSGWPDPPWVETTHSFFLDGTSDGGNGGHGTSNCSQGSFGDPGQGVQGTYTTPSGATSITISIGGGGSNGGGGDGYSSANGQPGAAWILGVQS